MKNKNIILIIVIILIILAIVLLQNTKNTKVDTINATKISFDDNSERVKLKSQKYQRVIELVDPNGYLNINNITIKENIGKNVILLDFWTFSCINCQRTIPYINSWYNKYKDKGLIIIGVHTPEFDFEKDYNNVQKAIEKYNIKYPVIQDNEYKTWTAYKNRYWPRKYLIDIDGFIVYDHIGEGSYEETELKIQELLKERNEILNSNVNYSMPVTKEINNKELDKYNIGITKETYFGYDYARKQLGNREGWKPNEIVTYTLPKDPDFDKFYLSGDWLNNKDNMELNSNKGSILIKYAGKEINFVAGSDNPVQITISINDVKYRELTIQDTTLYNLIPRSEYKTQTLKIDIKSPGLKAYTFTFG